MLKTILCVCSGNYCRSPMAEGLLRREVERRGQVGSIIIRSAGTEDVYEGEPPAPLVAQVVAELGGSLDGHRPHQVKPEEVAQADLILAIAQEHVDYIAARYPEAESKTMLLARSVGLDLDVPDPGVQELGLLRECANLVEGYVMRGYDEIVRQAMGQ